MALKLFSLAVQKAFVGNYTVNKMYLGDSLVYENETPITPLCFTSNDGGAFISYSVTGTVDTTGIQYSTDNQNWTNWDGTEIELANAGDKMYVRNTNNTLSTSTSDYLNFEISGDLVSASGNCNSLINNDEVSECCFYKLFQNCYYLVSAPLLPSNTLITYCYASMFENCTRLETAPELEILSAEVASCLRMFKGCTSLTTPPKLPALSLSGGGVLGCYQEMFYGCTSLNKLMPLPARTLPLKCYYQMFYGCSLIKLSETQEGEYQNAYRLPEYGQGTTASMSLQNMFTRTGGTFTGTPTINTTYYTSNEILS